MAFPNLTNDPAAFRDHLKASNLDFAIIAFNHYLAQPADSSNHLDEVTAYDWCERMDTLLVSFIIFIDLCFIDAC